MWCPELKIVVGSKMLPSMEVAIFPCHQHLHKALRSGDPMVELQYEAF